MTRAITHHDLGPYADRLRNHEVYAAVETAADLRCFMEHHVFSVWDFMSLIKYLQAIVAPAAYPWTPRADSSVCRFINELVLEEESDLTGPEGTYSSHYELYLRAMTEVGADTRPSMNFVQAVRTVGVDDALAAPSVPEPSRRFTEQTFRFIGSGRPHCVAAALALGREHVIPGMFRSILGRSGVLESEAPTFHYYLNKHIQLDEDFHAPLSLRLLNGLCEGDRDKVEEALEAARAAVQARLEFWDGVLAAIQARRRGPAVRGPAQLRST